MNILYLSYDGLTDPLGQSQILPYLSGLSKKGHKIQIITFEKPAKQAEIKILQDQVTREKLKWIPLQYTKNPPILSTIYDIYKLKKESRKLHLRERFEIVHCRSYITSLIGLYLRKKFNIKFIFDMRGFWADERVDGGIWNLNLPIYRWVYNYFKKKEKEFLIRADHIISLTFKAEEIIQSWKLKKEKLSISVIPTCVDTDHFHEKNIEPKKLSTLKTELGITPNNFLLCYLGSLGTWYLVKEMVEFYARLKKQIPEARFLVLTKDDKSEIFKFINQYKLDEADLLVISASREEVPYYISLANWTIFFIKPVFSKSASAPTKMAEIISMKKPIIFNLGVGDMDTFNEKFKIGYGIEEFNEKAYNKAADFMSKNLNFEIDRDLVNKHYNLENAITHLDHLYRYLSPG